MSRHALLSASSSIPEQVEMFFDFRCLIYSTHKHTPENGGIGERQKRTGKEQGREARFTEDVPGDLNKESFEPCFGRAFFNFLLPKWFFCDKISEKVKILCTEYLNEIQ